VQLGDKELGMQGRNRFTQSEADQIRDLLRQKAGAYRSEQKSIRGKLRRLGFYITDFDNSQEGFSVADFEDLVRRSLIAIVDDAREESPEPLSIKPSSADNKDEVYVIDLCDDVLGLRAKRQHRFDYLIGDAGTKLPVDAYYESLNLVVEYRERQHTEQVRFFDKPDRITVSGVHRGEQRQLYDQRRREVLPEHGVDLVEFSYSDFAHSSNKRIIRNREEDLKVIRSRLVKYVKD
jgi:hypothetical protein